MITTTMFTVLVGLSTAFLGVRSFGTFEESLIAEINQVVEVQITDFRPRPRYGCGTGHMTFWNDPTEDIDFYSIRWPFDQIYRKKSFEERYPNLSWDPLAFPNFTPSFVYPGTLKSNYIIGYADVIIVFDSHGEILRKMLLDCYLPEFGEAAISGIRDTGKSISSFRAHDIARYQILRIHFDLN